MPDAAPAARPPDPADDRSVALLPANLYALAFVVPAAVAAVATWIALWGAEALGDGLDAWFDRPLTLLAAVVLGTLAHELLHAGAWRAAGAPAGTVRLGFSWRALTPFAHCDVPMPARAYRIGAWAPGVVLGAVPLAAALALGAPRLFWFALLFTIAAGGDVLTMWLLRGVGPDRLVADHPSRAGCVVLDRGTAAEAAA